jgi:hypothetical protein
MSHTTLRPIGNRPRLRYSRFGHASKPGLRRQRPPAGRLAAPVCRAGAHLGASYRERKVKCPS